MRILVLGGTLFVGRHIVEVALARGHTVTLFNRGQTNPHLFSGMEKLRGDRSGDLRALEDREWDAVFDTSGELPRQVWETSALLADRVEHYTVLSSVMVYADLGAPTLDEDSPVQVLGPDDDVDEMTFATFGALKAMAEQAAKFQMPDRVLAVRAGLPVGPYDFTDRLAYWPRRVAQGGEVLAPGDPNQPIQFIDARDLAEWMVTMAERNETGVFNATGPKDGLTLGELLESCKEVTGSDATFTWVPDDFLLERDVLPLYDLPIWMPPDGLSMYSIDNSKAVAAGLTFRPLAETLRAVLEPEPSIARGNGRGNGAKQPSRPGETGIGLQEESNLLRAWHRS